MRIVKNFDETYKFLLILNLFLLIIKIASIQESVSLIDSF